MIPDITDRLLIQAGAKLLDNTLDIIIKGGKGVGTVTRKGLQIEVGETAINPEPKKMIRRNVEDVLKGCTGAEITIIVPEGGDVAKKTFNERLGIVRGLSIIGTTEIVTPMSVDALKATIACEIDIAVANGFSSLYLVPGKIGERFLKEVPWDVNAVMVSNYYDFVLGYLQLKGVKK